MTVVTGITSVGKTRIITESGATKIIFMDDVIKNVFYKRNFKLYWDIKEEFGKQYVSWRKVNTKKLGALVFLNKDKMDKLNKIVAPYIHSYLNMLKELKDDFIIEMAIYMNSEKEYSKYFDKVILIDRPQHKSSKFNHIEGEIDPIKKAKIKSNFVITAEKIEDAVEEFKKAIK